MASRIFVVLVVLAFCYGCGQASSPVERQEEGAGADQAAQEEGQPPATSSPSASGQGGEEAVSNIPVSGTIGENVETAEFGLRVLDLLETARYFYLTDPYLEQEEDHISEAGKFVVISYSVTNTSPQTINPTPIGTLHARAGDNIEVYEQSDRVIPPHRFVADANLPDIPPRQILVSQFVFDVPTDVEPELLVVNDVPQIDNVFELGAVDLTEEDPQGPRPEELLALQYEAINMQEWERAYELFAQESKDLVSLEDYTSVQRNTQPPEGIVEYSFPSVEVEGDQATMQRVITSATSEGETQFKAIQEAVLEDEGWRIVMREDQYDAYIGGFEETTG